ncbi:MAG: hypothetical protein LIP10_14920 [Clostridiales bacterium]|nr:hypothetical protein [Clostridiales bacterium]
MKTMMEAIFDGKLYPAEKVVPESKEYWDAIRDAGAQMEELESLLSEDDYGKVEKLCDLMSVESDCQNKEFFKYGLSLGMALMCEASDALTTYSDENGNISIHLEENQNPPDAVEAEPN